MPFSKDELDKVLRGLGLTPSEEQLTEEFEAVDLNKDGQVSFEGKGQNCPKKNE